MSVLPARLARALEEHRASVERFLATAATVPESAWRSPRSPGKWSADETAEHLRLALETIARELSGGEPMRRVLGRPRETLYRWTVLPVILRTGRFPRGVKSPREARPRGPGLSRADAMAGLRAEMERMESSAARTGNRRVTHVYFGRIPLDAMLMLFARHTDHHAAQIGARGESAARH